MATDLIRYDLLVQDAMRGVMRRVLTDVALNGGLPGDHHFTISFRTGAPGVKISKRLAEQWPSELTIILQHQYSDLMVNDEGFAVTLSFRGKPENLYIPFAAVTGFFDPSVEFGLRFETAGEEDDEDQEEQMEEKAPPPARPGPSLVTTAREPAPAKTAPAKAEKPKLAVTKSAETKQAEPKNADAPGQEDGAAKIVSIDAFRKKT
jgi:hypothetical protein